MNNKNKKIFLITTLVFLLVGLNTITANEVNNNQTNDNIQENTLKEVNTQPNNPTTNTENKKQFNKTKQSSPKKTTNLEIKFLNNPEDEDNTENYKTTHINEEYTIDITLTQDEDQTPIPAIIQLYLQEDTQPQNITLDQTGHIQKTYNSQEIGTYLIHAEYEGNNEYYDTTSDTIILSIEQYTSTITYTPIQNTCYNSTIIINGTLTSEETPLEYKNIKISFNNNHIITIQTNKEGQFTYPLNLENIPIQKNAQITLEYNSDNITHSSAYKKINFDIEKIKNNIQINTTQNTVISNKTSIQIKITDENKKNYTGTIIATITNINTNTTLYNNTLQIQNGTTSFNYTPKTSGNYNITIITTEDNYYIKSINSTQFHVEKQTPILNINDAYYSMVQENISLYGKLLNEYQQPIPYTNITISTDNQTITTLTTDQQGSFNYTNYMLNETTEEEYVMLHFDIKNDENCYNLHKESKLYVIRRNVNVTLKTEDYVKINGTINIEGQVTDAINETKKIEGTIKVYINNLMIKDNITVNDGEYNSTINIKENYIGNDTLCIEAFFIPDNPRVYYRENYAEKTIIHLPLDTQLTVNANDSIVDDTVNIIITLQDENNNSLEESVDITITNDEENIILFKQVQLTDGKGNISFTPSIEGLYHIISEYPGQEDIYTQSINSTQIYVRKTDTKQEINKTPDELYVNDTVKITGKLLDENNNTISKQNLQIIINTTTTNITDTIQTDNNGIYEYEFKILQSEQYNITIAFDGTNKYNTNIKNIILNPIKHDTQVIISQINTTKYNTTITIKGEVHDKEKNITVNGSVTIILNNKTIETIQLINGQYQTQYTIKNIQNNKLLIVFNENNVFTQSNETISFDTIPLTTKITINPIENTQINKEIIITGKVTDENDNYINGRIQLTINNQLINDTLPVNNSTYQVTFKTDTVGQNTINISFTPDNTCYTNTTATTTFNVHRTNLEVTDIEKTVDQKFDTITIKGKLVNNNNLTTSNIKVSITCDNKTYIQTTNNEGTFTITTDNLQPNSYTLQLTVNQTNYFNSYEKNLGKIIIDKKTPVINNNPIENATYSKTAYITGNLTDKYNRPLTQQNITIITDNNKFHGKTDENGKYNITITDFQAGTNNISIIVPKTPNTYKKVLNTTFNAKKDDVKIIIDLPEQVIPGQTLIINGKLVNTENQNIANRTVNLTINDKTIKINTDNNGKFTYSITNINSGKYDVNITFEDSNHNRNNTYKQVTVNKLGVKLLVDDIIARVGEYITFHATLQDSNGNPVNGGNLVFKLNGRTLRNDGRFDTNTCDVIKFNVTNGKVEYTLTADLYLRHGKNISASYSGTYKYLSAKSNTATANIQLRYANINITTNKNKVKHHENITFTAIVKDITPNSEQNLLNNNGTVFFKINGVTIKDKQNKIIRAQIINNTAKLTYNITTMAGIDKNNNPRNYTVTAVYDTPYYYPQNNKNTTTFNVERSTVNINIQETKVNNNFLQVKANMTDYKGLNIIGTSKICIKINGVTYKEKNISKYFTIKDGVIDIKNINVEGMKVKRLEIVTGQRLAYLASRQTTTKIT